MTNPHKSRIRELKSQMRRVEQRIARIVLTFGDEPTDRDIAKALDTLSTEWTNLRFGLSTARANARGEQSDI